MLKTVLNHHIRGIISSVNIFPLYASCMSNSKLSMTIRKIIKFNMTLMVLPYFAFSLCRWCGLNLMMLPWIYYVCISVISGIFHAIHYFDINQIVSIGIQKTDSELSLVDKISIMLTMMIYQFVIYLTTTIIEYLLFDKLYLLMIIIRYIVIVIYHALYCYNNVWQRMNINIERRIDILEKLWPYYFGYASIISIIYFYTSNPIFAALYNILLIVALSNPFLIKVRFPSNRKYFQINLSIFTFILDCIIGSTKIIIGIF